MSDVHSGHEEASSTTPSSTAKPAYWVALVALVGAGTLLASVFMRALAYLRPETISPELADRATWVSAAGFTATGLFIIMWQRPRKILRGMSFSTLAGFIALTVIAVGIAWTEYVADLPHDIQEGWWHGFGPTVALATAIMIPIVAQFEHPSFTPLIRYLACLSVIVAVVWYLPTLINPPWSFDAHHANPVINDVLGPYVGRLPFIDQVPQYTSMLGFPLAPVLLATTTLLGSGWVVLVTSAYLSALAILTVALLVWVTKRILPPRISNLALLIALPVILVSGSGGGTIGQSFSAFPARLLLPVLLITLLIAWWPRLSTLRLLTIGFAAGFGVVNNPEFGIIAFVAVLLSVFIGCSGSRWRTTTQLLFGGVVGIAFVFLTLELISGGVRYEFFTAYARAFGEGSLSLAMPSAGTFLLVLSLSAASLVYAVYWLGFPRVRQEALPGVAAVFSGVMALGSFFYYAGRSSSTGQLQALLPFFAVSLAATIGMIGLPGVTPRMRKPELLTRIVTASALAFSLATLLQAPDPRSQWGKIVPDGSTSFLNADLDSASAIEAAVKTLSPMQLKQPFTIAMDNGNIDAAVLGIANVSPLSYIEDASLSQDLGRYLCTAITSTSTPTLMANATIQAIPERCKAQMNFVRLNDTFSVATRIGS